MAGIARPDLAGLGMTGGFPPAPYGEAQQVGSLGMAPPVSLGAVDASVEPPPIGAAVQTGAPGPIAVSPPLTADMGVVDATPPQPFGMSEISLPEPRPTPSVTARFSAAPEVTSTAPVPTPTPEPIATRSAFDLYVPNEITAPYAEVQTAPLTTAAAGLSLTTPTPSSTTVAAAVPTTALAPQAISEVVPGSVPTMYGGDAASALVGGANSNTLGAGSMRDHLAAPTPSAAAAPSFDPVPDVWIESITASPSLPTPNDIPADVPTPSAPAPAATGPSAVGPAAAGPSPEMWSRTPDSPPAPTTATEEEAKPRGKRAGQIVGGILGATAGALVGQPILGATTGYKVGGFVGPKVVRDKHGYARSPDGRFASAKSMSSVTGSNDPRTWGKYQGADGSTIDIGRATSSPDGFAGEAGKAGFGDALDQAGQEARRDSGVYNDSDGDGRLTDNERI